MLSGKCYHTLQKVVVKLRLVGENRRHRKKSCSGAPLSTMNLILSHPAPNARVCSEKPATT